MFWLFLYVYAIGIINDVMFALSEEVDMSHWSAHLNIALWPITVPAALVIAMFAKPEA